MYRYLIKYGYRDTKNYVGEFKCYGRNKNNIISNFYKKYPRKHYYIQSIYREIYYIDVFSEELEG